MIPIVDLIKEAKADKYAIGAFNVYNMEIIQAVVESANEERAPFILAFTPSHIKYCGIEYLKGLMNAALKTAEVPFGLNLDHGRNMSDIVLAIKLGFSSIMVDGSSLPLMENIKYTQKVVQLAHLFDVMVEGEVGRIIGEEERGIAISNAKPTDPKEAKKFVDSTGIDILSVSVGTVHGMKHRNKVKVDISLIRKIAEVITIPLALHGSFRTPEEVICEAVEAGICKVNLALHFWEPFIRGVEDSLRDRKDIIDPQSLILSKAKANMKEEMKRQFRILRASNRVQYRRN
jgi:fructose-bisphosphate aldolase class II